MEDLATDAYDKRNNGTAGVTYAEWDQEKIMGCKCDPYYEGHDCSARMCPRGDDPITSDVMTTMSQVIHLGSTTAAHQFFLTYFDPYGNAWNTAAIAPTGATTTVCDSMQAALRKLPNRALEDVSVASIVGAWYKAGTRNPLVDTDVNGTMTASESATTAVIGQSCKVTFPNNSGTTGLQSILGCTQGGHNAAGSQPMFPAAYTHACTVLEWVSAASLTKVPLSENAVCANRGLCDSSSGTCECFDGHTGVACEIQEALV
jgi:hypothetical protein